jgi:uncharacterized membrane protein required for colicin V production
MRPVPIIVDTAFARCSLDLTIAIYLPAFGLLGGVDDLTRSIVRVVGFPVSVWAALMIGTPVICFFFWRALSRG